MPRATEVDAIIVGAGPAGSATALLLARAGHTVALLDRRRFPRSKPCGDCLSAEAARVLDRLGVLAAVLAAQPARLEGWRIVSPTGQAFQAPFADAADGDPRVTTALSLPRHRFDSILLDAARRAGALVRIGTHLTDLRISSLGRVTGVHGRGPDGSPLQLRARLVVGADGLRSIVARRLGLTGRLPKLRKVSLTAHLTGIRDIDRFGEMHIARRSCAGLAPVSTTSPDDERICNLTLVVDADLHARAIARDATAFYWTMLRQFPRLAHRIDSATHAERPDSDDRRPRLLASGPFDRPTRDTVADGAALVGDAAGYYDPFTGQGIYHALVAAEILAEEADAALRADDVSRNRLRRYARRHARLIREARALQRVIEFVIARPALAEVFIRRLARTPRTAAALIAATADLRPARSVARPDVLLDFLLPTARPESNA